MSKYEIYRMVEALEFFGLENAREKAKRFSIYFQMISENRLWGSLTSRRVAQDPIIPVVQSLSMLEVLNEPGFKGIGEIGSGGGILGITMAIAKDNWRFTLIESSSRKSAFLAEVCGKLGLKNVTVRRCMAENLIGSLSFDSVISRAAGKLDSLLRVGLGLVEQGGLFAVIKGKSQRQEVESVIRASKALTGSDEIRENIRFEVVEPELPDWLPENSSVLIVAVAKMLEDIEGPVSKDLTRR